MGDKLSSGQAARRLGISHTHIAELARAGKVAFTPTPLGRLFDPAEIERLAEERAAKARAGARS